VVRGHHPDVHTCLAEADAVARGLLEWTESRRQPSREIKVEQVRALRDGLRMAPYEGGWRVAVIPQAERLRVEAGNALLKTLEEPLPRTLLVLCAPDRQAVLPTLVSRCQVVPFSPLSEEVLVSLVRRRRGLDDEAARAVAREAQGSATRAMAEEPGKAAAAWDQARDWLRALEGGAPHVLTGMAESMEKDREGLERRVERLARLAVHEAEAGMAAGAAERARFHARVAADAMALQAELSLPGATVRLALERFSLRPRVRAGPDRAW
jgi:DNA polymerase-3 subunit delta'